MAKVEIQRVWPDGDELLITIRVDASYPDALSEAKRTALDVYAEALGVTLADVPEET
ncbi:MAG: hypothetical protein H0X12_04105 [Nocardioides sp.]|nr:hypothetical protein [Nocardioides sp.]